MNQFKFWCQKVLPLVYDNSLSYYEVLCKVVDYINNLIKSNNEIIDDVDGLKRDVNTVENWIENFNYSEIDNIIRQYIATCVFFQLTNSGYFVAYIPESWNDITFGTTGYDTDSRFEPEFGHLVLKY